MKPANIFAYTAPGIAPEYISINRANGQIAITVRSTPISGEVYGYTATAILPADKLDELIFALRKERPCRLVGSAEIEQAKRETK